VLERPITKYSLFFFHPPFVIVIMLLYFILTCRFLNPYNLEFLNLNISSIIAWVFFCIFNIHSTFCNIETLILENCQILIWRIGHGWKPYNLLPPTKISWHGRLTKLFQVAFEIKKKKNLIKEGFKGTLPWPHHHYFMNSKFSLAPLLGRTELFLVGGWWVCH